MSIDFAIAAPVIGAVNSGLSNFVAQAISGRKPVNLCSVAGATVGGAAGGIIRAGAQAALSGATTVQGTQLAAPVTNAIGSALTLGTALLPPAVSQIGRGLCGS